jgi:excisionase family DNA binding protein
LLYQFNDMSQSDTKQTILISLQVEEFQTIIIDCVNACLKHNQPTSGLKTDQEEILTVPQLADLLSLAIPTIYGLIHRRELPAMKRGNRVYFKRSQILEYLEQGSIKTIADIEKGSILKTRKGSIGR